MATLRQRFDRNQIPMQTVAALSGTHLAEVSRLVSGRGQKVLDSKAAAIESALTQRGTVHCALHAPPQALPRESAVPKRLIRS